MMALTETCPCARSESQSRQRLRVERPIGPQPSFRVELVHVRLPEGAIHRVRPAGGAAGLIRHVEGLVPYVCAAHEGGALGHVVAQEVRVGGGLADDLGDHVALAQQLFDRGVEVGDVGRQDGLDGWGLR